MEPPGPIFTLRLSEHALAASQKALRRNHKKNTCRDHQLPANIKMMRQLINTYKERIPIEFDERKPNEHYTPSVEQSSVLCEGYDLSKDLPWCRFLREKDKHGKRDTSYSKQNAAAIWFELAPNNFEAMEQQHSFITSVKIAMYHCFPYYTRKIHVDGHEIEYSGLVRINESARCGKRPRKDLIDPNKGERAGTFIPERMRNSFDDEDGVEWVSERQERRMKLDSQLQPNNNPDDTNRGLPTLNTPLQKIISHQYRHSSSPPKENSLLWHGELHPSVIEWDKVIYQPTGTTWWNSAVGSSSQLHPLVDPETYLVGTWNDRDPLKTALNQDEEHEPTSVPHRVRGRHGVVPFDPGKQLMDPSVITGITGEITQYLERPSKTTSNINNENPSGNYQ